MEYSIAHQKGMNTIGQSMFSNGKVPWEEATPPNIKKGDKHWTGHLRNCAYCGSMHPSDVVAAIKSGARGEWADMKYGWPHKAYFEGVPNPHAGMLEIRASSNHEHEGWIKEGVMWHEPGTPASPTTGGKFYTVHLMDATPEERETIETHLGLKFDFSDDGMVRWHRVQQPHQADADPALAVDPVIDEE